MPDTPIDLSEGIQSIRLKVPTGPVPIPPEGWGQLHSPAPGELAIRLPDGSVVAVGGGGAPQTSLHNPYGSQINLDGTDPTIGVLLGIAPGQQWVIDPPVFPVDIYRKPLGLRVATVPISSAELLALHTTPTVLVPAVADKIVVPLALYYQYQFVTTAYEWGGNFLRLGMPGSIGAYSAQDPLTLGLGGAFSRLAVEMPGAPFGVFTTLEELVGLPLQLTATGDPTLGDGSLVVTVVYLVV